MGGLWDVGTIPIEMLYSCHFVDVEMKQECEE